MNFHEVRFPNDLSMGSIGGPERRTEIVSLSNGHEERNSPWAQSRRRYDAGLGARSLDDLQHILSFFEARGARLYGFRWKDWTDFKSCEHSRDLSAVDQHIGTGDDITSQFQLVKNYRSGIFEQAREISKPVDSTVCVAIGGDELVPDTDFSVDYLTGKLTFANPPADGAPVTAGFEFDVPVRFDTDRIEVSAVGFSAGEIPSIPVIEVRI